MKLEVGMYVRYKYENCIYIGKIKFISEVMGYDETLQIDIDNCMEEILKEDILKASHNIIDLIEVGDYVNGYKVSFKDNDYKPFVQCDYPVQEGTTNHYRFYEEAIYSIVTKEQFLQMEYKVEE